MALTTTLHHPNIARVTDLIEHTDPPALVMEYVNGENLESFQTRLPYILPEAAILIVIEILKALEYAHAQKLIHRDLKPENVLISHEGLVKVVDFGLAKLENASMITQTNMIVGTIDYMSPEQVRGDTVTERSDLFSVAAILYFLTTGTRPFSRASSLSTLKAIQDENAEGAHKRNPKISSAFIRIIQKGLQKDPKSRYQSATEFRNALETYLASLGLTEDHFSLKTWILAPTPSTLEALRNSVERLTQNCEIFLKHNKLDAFLEDISHLSLKAPESPAIFRLRSQYKSKQRRIKAIRVAILVLLIGIPVFLGMRYKNYSKAVLTPAPVPQPMGTVHFNVAKDIKVFWNDKLIDPSQPLNNQAFGEYSLRLERVGFAPIKTVVKVTDLKPVEINVK